MVNTESRLINSLQPKMEKLYTVSKNKTGNSLWLTSSASQSKFRLNLNKPGKTTKPVRYNLNQVPYEYVMEVMNRFKGLDLVNVCLKSYGWRSEKLYRRQ